MMFKHDVLRLPKTLYFFRKRHSAEYYTKDEIKATFDAIRDSKRQTKRYIETYLDKVSINSCSTKTIPVSTLCFSYKEKVSFINPTDAPDETKYALFCLIDFGQYVAIAKRNIALPPSIQDQLRPFSRNELAACFITESTCYEHISTVNISGNPTAIRYKKFSAKNLADSLPGTGNAHDAIRSLSLRNGDQLTGITLSTSCLNNFKKAPSFNDLVNWAGECLSRLTSGRQCEHKEFIESFAQIGNYEEMRDSLTPICISIVYEHLTQVLSEHGNEADLLSLPFDETITLEPKQGETTESVPRIYRGNSEQLGSLELHMNEQEIHLTLGTEKHLHTKEGDLTWETFLNQDKAFFVYFSKTASVYYAGYLHTYNQNPSQIKKFLKLFIPCQKLMRTESEKPSSSQEKKYSIFEVVEQEISKQHRYAYLVCDDCGEEWADHIALRKHRVAFFASKYKPLEGHNIDERVRVSDLHIIVSQVQKNLHFLKPDDRLLSRKQALWEKQARNNKIVLRTQKGKISDAVAQWKDNIQSHKTRYEVNIVINFISLKTVAEYCNNLYREDFNQQLKASFLQLYCLLTHLESACHQYNAQLHIYCPE